MKQLFILLVFFVLSVNSYAQNATIPVHQLDSLLVAEQKPVLFFIHTDWCRYCLMMEQQVFTDPEIATQLGEDFYFVKLNAEDRTPITFSGRTFSFLSTGANTGIHELARELGTIDGKIAYPTITILNKQMEIIFQHGSAVKKQQFKKILKAAVK